MGLLIYLILLPLVPLLGTALLSLVADILENACLLLRTNFFPRWFCRLRIQRMIRVDPLQRMVVDEDTFAPTDEGLVATAAFQGLQKDALGIVSNSISRGGMLVLRERFGMGKSYTSIGVALGRYHGAPTRSLAVTGGEASVYTKEWYANVKSALGIEGDIHRGEVANMILGPLKNKWIHTRSSKRIDFVNTYDGGSPKRAYGMLVLEDFNPIELAELAENLKKEDENREPTLLEMIRAIDPATWSFLQRLVQGSYGRDVLVIITTESTYAMKLLHEGVNGRQKCYMAPSACADPNDRDSEYIGLNWDVEARKPLFSGAFPLKDPAAIDNYAGMTEKTIRSLMLEIAAGTDEVDRGPPTHWCWRCLRQTMSDFKQDHLRDHWRRLLGKDIVSGRDLPQESYRQPGSGHLA